MRPTFRMRALCAAALSVAAPLSMAAGVNDAFGDYVAGFTGSRLGDLDVLSSIVTYNPATDKFVFSGTFAADVGTTAGGFYVWGVNRGAGTAGFAANGLPNVLFDSVVIFNQDGSARITGTNPATLLPAGSAKVFGSTIIGEIDGSFLPSTGFAKADYTWNLWPRDGRLTGFAAISDFAPDSSNVGVTVVGAVPEPTTYALMALGLGAIGLQRRRRALARP
jgi:hypothetical protein